MVAKKTHTIADLAEDIQGLTSMITPIIQDVNMLKNWKIAEDAYRAALKQVRTEEQTQQYDALKTKEAKAWLGILKQLGPIITILAALLYAYAATKGLH